MHSPISYSKEPKILPNKPHNELKKNFFLKKKVLWIEYRSILAKEPTLYQKSPAFYPESPILYEKSLTF